MNLFSVVKLSCRPARRIREMLSAAALIAIVSCIARAEDQVQFKVEAPRNQAIVGSKPGGVYYAAKPLKEEHDQLLQRIYALRSDIFSGKIDGRQTAAKVEELQLELQRVQGLMETTKTLIEYAQTTVKSENLEFELGSEQLLFVRDCSKVHFIGWDQPKVKCVLEKVVVGKADHDFDKDFAEIRLVHRHGIAKSEEVGLSRKEIQDSDEKFLASPEGKKLTDDQLATRRRLLDRAFASQDYFRGFQGKPIDLIRLEGLTHQQGNRPFSYEVRSPGGNGQSGSIWHRHANLTIYVPSCKGVGLDGGLAGLEVEGVNAPLIVRGNGDRDYLAHSFVSDHKGSVTIENIPLESIDSVQGDVSVTVSTALGNSGVRHQQGQKIQYFEFPAFYVYRKIEGNFTALLLNINLELSAVSGRIDISNEFGNTQLTVPNPLVAAAHRVVSESGSVTLQLAADALKNVPLVAASECGAVRVSDGAPPLVDGNISSFPGDGLTRRTYRGFSSPPDEKAPFGRFEQFQRLESLYTREEKPPGLNVLSRSGIVQIEPFAPPAARATP